MLIPALLIIATLQQNDSAAFVRKLIAAINTHQEAPRLALRHAKDVCVNDEVRRLAFTRQAKYVASPSM
ncbi:MAG TPA: hypothetical protein VM100_00565, partial [Longimicrobiales bacterium]|nr:hypothetical protein [Longimicrobiales bacterium]